MKPWEGRHTYTFEFLQGLKDALAKVPPGPEDSITCLPHIIEWPRSEVQALLDHWDEAMAK
jgi:hypothetical protein